MGILFIMSAAEAGRWQLSPQSQDMCGRAGQGLRLLAVDSELGVRVDTAR